MKKLSGHICDSCRTMFYPEDHIVELCEKCANQVWVVTNIYEDDFRELASIHHTEESAKDFIEKGKEVINLLNKVRENKLIKQDISNWAVL